MFDTLDDFGVAEVDSGDQEASPRAGGSPRLALAAIGLTIGRAIGAPFRIQSAEPVAGGQTREAYVVTNGRRRFFVKVAPLAEAPAFDAERDGLVALKAAGLRVPEPFGCGAGGGYAHIVLEHLALVTPRQEDHARLGHALAGLHMNRGQRFGWPRANFIGAAPQSNTQSSGWARFFMNERLAPQLAIAAKNNYSGLLQSLGERVLAAVPRILAGHHPYPALVHGDLWCGNLGVADGQPVFYDPAVHYADREVDLAMAELFGGLPPAFYAAYHQRLPIDPGYPRRRELYNLYHVLNHLNLFGGSYREQAEARMRQILAEI